MRPRPRAPPSRRWGKRTPASDRVASSHPGSRPRGSLSSAVSDGPCELRLKSRLSGKWRSRKSDRCWEQPRHELTQPNGSALSKARTISRSCEHVLFARPDCRSPVGPNRRAPQRAGGDDSCLMENPAGAGKGCKVALWQKVPKSRSWGEHGRLGREHQRTSTGTV